MPTSEVDRLLRREGGSPDMGWPPRSEAASWELARERRLKGMNVPAERHGRIMRLVDLPQAPGEDGEPDRRQIVEAFKSLHSDMPEVFGEGATVQETALDTSTGDTDQDAPLTIEAIESIDPEQINEPGMWERVQRFMAGER